MPSSIPENVAAQVHSSRQFSLSWEAPRPEGRNGIIINYVVRITSTSTSQESFINTGQLSLDFPTSNFDVLPYKTYILQVAAATVVGRGPFSEDVIVVTPEDRKFAVMKRFKQNIMTIHTWSLWMSCSYSYVHVATELSLESNYIAKVHHGQ